MVEIAVSAVDTNVARLAGAGGGGEPVAHPRHRLPRDTGHCRDPHRHSEHQSWLQPAMFICGAAIATLTGRALWRSGRS